MTVGDPVLWLSVSTGMLGALAVGRLIWGRDRRSSAVDAAELAASRAWADELAETLEEARAARAWATRLADIGSSLDVDEVLSLSLAMAVDIPGADAALIALRPVAGTSEPLVASVGMSAEEADGRLADLPEGVRTTVVSYRYEDGSDPTRPVLLGGFVVPLEAGEEQIGSLAVFWRRHGREPGEQDVATLEELARRTALATRNARQFARSRELASRDPVTLLANRRFLEDALGHEVPRAHRYGHPLTVLMLGIDGIEANGGSAGAPAGPPRLAELAGGIRQAVRECDVACYLGGDEFVVVMPESQPDGAATLATRLRGTIRTATGGHDGLELTAGVAQLHKDETPQRLLERAGEALRRARTSGPGQVRGWAPDSAREGESEGGERAADRPGS